MISTTRGRHNLAAVEFKKASRVRRAKTSAGVTAYSWVTSKQWPLEANLSELKEHI